MSQSELLKRAALALEELGVSFLLSGSLASSFQGEPRATHDVDLVVDLRPEQVDGLVARFPPPQYYLDRGAALDAIARQAMFNLLDTLGGDKIDFWLLTPDPFDQSRFARRRRVALGNVELDISAPEDTILMKLKWAHESGGSEKQMGDATGVYQVQRGTLDESYIEHWARELGITDLWRRVQQDAIAPREIGVGRSH